jgi:hypothetical protein
MKNFVLSLCLLAASLACPLASQGQIRLRLPLPRIGVGVELAVPAVPPVCEYGYYDYAPYACAPVGFYSEDYFYNGIFIGVGPWAGWGYGHGWGGHRFNGGNRGRGFGGHRK